ncbi:MAG TPA: prenyltransferase [Conexivisphaerales archaeon]|nr:prenyltransferase [Conexivisphaerales archaeon]
MNAKTLFLATRPWSFTMTFSSVTLGSLLAALAGSFNAVLYAATLAGMIAFHAATNLLNDFYDVKHGVDRVGAPTTRYRPHPSATGEESPYTIRRWAVAFYAVTLAIAGVLSYEASPWVVVLVAAGIVGSVLYTADPVVLKAKGLGEAIVFIMWGPLVPLGAYLVQTGTFSTSPIIAAVPIGLLVALVLLANNIRDIDYDGSMGVKTIAVKLGKKAVTIYGALLLITYLCVPLFIAVKVLPVWSLLTYLTLPGALGLWKMFKGQVPDNADPRTAGVAFQFALLYMVSLVLQILVPLHLF